MSNCNIEEFNTVMNYVDYKIREAHDRINSSRVSSSAALYQGNYNQLNLWYSVRQSLELDFCAGAFSDK